MRTWSIVFNTPERIWSESIEEKDEKFIVQNLAGETMNYLKKTFQFAFLNSLNFSMNLQGFSPFRQIVAIEQWTSYVQKGFLSDVKWSSWWCEILSLDDYFLGENLCFSQLKCFKFTIETLSKRYSFPMSV